ncbi:MAG: ATP-binding protein [Phycisphaerae bacterium]|nr:ATP-binding protein [Phycisphaerae bacterium]
MRSLFAKTLLTFLLANALVAAVSIALSYSLQWPHPAHVILQPLLQALGRASAGLIEAGEEPLAREISDWLRNDSGIDARLATMPRTEPTVSAPALPAPKAVGRFKLLGFEFTAPIVGRRDTYLLQAMVPAPSPRASVFSYTDLAWRAAIALGTVALVCYVFAAYLVAPVRKLQTAARTIAAGDLHARVGPAIGRRRDELGKLAHDFDRMADHIDALVTEQKQLFRHASHELRSPLARLQVAVGLLRQKHDDPLYDRIELECEALDRQIDDLLSLARLESGAQIVKRAPVDLTRLIRELASDAAFEARGRGSEAVLAVEPVEVEALVVADEGILRSALENVVRNAIAYTADRTRVELRLARAIPSAGASAPSWSFTVQDRGPGVPPEQINAVFDPFFRGRGSGVGGLGLAIAKRGIELFGGSIRAENSDGGGLLVTIRLPVAKRD